MKSFLISTWAYILNQVHHLQLPTTDRSFEHLKMYICILSNNPSSKTFGFVLMAKNKIAHCYTLQYQFFSSLTGKQLIEQHCPVRLPHVTNEHIICGFSNCFKVIKVHVQNLQKSDNYIKFLPSILIQMWLAIEPRYKSGKGPKVI